MKKIAAICLVLLAASCALQPAYADECVAGERVRAMVMERFADAVWRELSPAERAAFMRSFNDEEPKTNIVASSVGYASRADGPGAFLIVVDSAGCVAHAGPVLRTAIDAALGEGV